MEELADLWRYRDLVVQLVRRDVVARYQGAEGLGQDVLRIVVQANPLHRLIALFRGPLYDEVWPDPITVLLGALWAGAALGAGWLVFANCADECPYRG